MPLNADLLVACHCYAGDRHQVLELLPYLEHHQAPVVVVSPANSQVHNIGPHICRCEGGVGYTGQITWDRQHLQLKALLDYPQKWFLLNDADSFCITPKLPNYLFEDDNVVYSNQVDDFRIPGQSWRGQAPWPLDFHKGYPLIAMQPPYFLSRNALEKIVKSSEGMKACPICPFIDWWWVPVCYAAKVKHKPFRKCASCETNTDHGRAVMRECVVKHGAQFIHAIKRGDIARDLVDLYKRNHGS